MTDAVHFAQIGVRLMPGFPRGGLELDGLAGGINVVYGPNASGKTTLARAMRRLLGPHRKGRQTDSLTAELVVAGQSFAVDYHLGKIVCKSGGHEVPVPPLASMDVGERYVLALHDLIRHEDDQDIVHQILQEAAGGYDVVAAARSLGFDRDRPSARNIRPVRDYGSAARDRKKAEEELLRIDRDAQQLAGLESQRNKSFQAQRRQELVQDALDALAKKNRLEEARTAVATFPDAMSRLIGDEWQRLNDLNQKMMNAREKLAQENRTLSEAQGEIAASGLPEFGVPAECIATLHNRCETLRSCSAEISRKEAERDGAQEALKDALGRLGPEVSPERAARLDNPMLAKLFDFVRKAEEQRLEKAASDRLASWLAAVPSSGQDAESLHEGILLLQRWLAQHGITPKGAELRLEWLVAAGITALVSVSMAFFYLSWLLLLVLAGGMTAWAFWPRPRSPRVANDEIPEQWGELGLAPPAAWTPTDVRASLRRLQQEWAAAQLQGEKHLRFADLQERRDRCEQRQHQIDNAQHAWRNLLGLDINPDDARSYLMAGAIYEAQSAQARLIAAQAELIRAQQDNERILAAINADLKLYSATTADDGDQASALVRNLDERRQAHHSSLERYKQTEADIEDCNRQIAGLDNDRTKLFSRMGLTGDDELTLRQWTDQFPQYQQAREDLRLAERDADAATAKLAGHDELLAQSHEWLQMEFDRCRTLAQDIQTLDEKLGDIRGRIHRAKEATALEAALAQEEACRDELRVARDNDCAKLVGKVLIDYLAQQQRDTDQPNILARAAALFARITHGRYKLLVESGDPPGFRALDTSLGRQQNLDELSSGTRLQLLLSARVAFVEQQEHGLQLPLIFDETLGNSDEQRAKKIIASAVELARRGRQVFYFTAQHDELSKWRRVLRSCTGISHREFDLARLRGFSEIEHAPEELEFEPYSPPPIPAPEGDDWISYGRRLNVPSINYRDHVGGVHLWYIVDDVDELYRLLIHDINKWGQLQTLVDIGSAEGLNRESPTFLRAAAAARLLQNLFHYCRHGRGEPVDRAILEASGAVSDTFLDEVDELSQSLDGNAQRLIAELRDGRVQRFRDARIDDLEDYLKQCGCIDDQPILDAAAIRAAISPLVFGDCEKGLLSHHRVDQLVALATRTVTHSGPTPNRDSQ